MSRPNRDSAEDNCQKMMIVEFLGVVQSLSTTKSHKLLRLQTLFDLAMLRVHSSSWCMTPSVISDAKIGHISHGLPRSIGCHAKIVHNELWQQSGFICYSNNKKFHYMLYILLVQSNDLEFVLMPSTLWSSSPVKTSQLLQIREMTFSASISTAHQTSSICSCLSNAFQHPLRRCLKS